MYRNLENSEVFADSLERQRRLKTHPDEDNEKGQTRKRKSENQICKRILKRFSRKAVVVFTNIINVKLGLRFFPREWKSVFVIMLPKNGKSNTFSPNCRLIRLLPAMSKIAKRIIGV